jgi:DNA mismatch repair protein MutL
LPRIRLLPAALADQIAAGEVVERPASVLKELVENALDAGARRVEIAIERGGLGKITVRDDGEGMSAEDAQLCLRRHATSKLSSAEELFALASFGFRGEALPSIASVSTLRLTTRRAEDTAAWQLTVRAGRVDEAREVGAPSGTLVEVSELFANVPARLKFQRGAGVEAGHCVDTVLRLSLSRPEVYLRLRVDGRAALELPPHASLAERAGAILRRGSTARVASARLEEGPVRVEVHVTAPEAALQTARRVHLVVNRRAIRDRGLLSAVQLGYGDLLPRGKHPLAVVSVELPPADLDVNVHPQKLEVRMARAAEVMAAVRHAVARAVAAGGFVLADAGRGDDPSDVALIAAEPELDYDADDEGLPRGDERGRAYELVRALAADEAARIEASEPVVAATPTEPRYLGALPGGYVLFRDRAGLLVVDQHAAAGAVAEAAGRPLSLDEPAWPTLDAGAATSLLDQLITLERRAELPISFRGRRPLLRVTLAELWRRLEA